MFKADYFDIMEPFIILLIFGGSSKKHLCWFYHMNPILWIKIVIEIDHHRYNFIFNSKFKFKNSLLLPIYSFGHTYIQFVLKYNTIHTKYITTKLLPTFLGAPLKVNAASWNIKGNSTGTIMDVYTGIKGLIHYTHNSHVCTIEFSCIKSLRPGDA